MNIEDTLAPTSDQLDSVELIGGPRVFTIAGVSKGSAEQPINIEFAEFPRPWRPGKSMRRVLAAAWGTEAAAWVGRRVELFCDPDIVFGKDRVGGTRVKSMSDLPNGKRFSVPLLVSRGKTATYTVEPLVESGPTADDVAACADRETLRSWWPAASPELRKVIEARVTELDGAE